MPSNLAKLSFATFALMAASAVISPAAVAAETPDYTPSEVRGAEKAFREGGATGLRRYIYRTRMIYALSWANFAKED
jgi:hypothetical protein